jgi:hypothetical protein
VAEEIWTVSTGTTVPVQPLLNPRGSRPGASAQAAYQRCRHKERQHVRDRRWRLRFHPSANARFWRRQAQTQRRTAGILAQLDQEGWLVLHDVALPGWSASLDHLVIGPTGAWAIDSWHSTRPPRADLSWKAEAVAEPRGPRAGRRGPGASARALQVLRPAA